MKNKLIMYQGGGYDGCFWEWNFCCYDSSGVWHDIFSSGRAGLKTEDAFKAVKIKSGVDHAEVYPLTEKGFKRFEAESDAVLVVGVAKFLNGLEYNFRLTCPDCGQPIDPDEAQLVDWHGCGGIMSTADKFICSDCYSSRSCAYCGEYYGESFEPVGDEGYCLDCAIRDLEQKIERLRRQITPLEFGNPEHVAAMYRIENLTEDLNKLKGGDNE